MENKSFRTYQESKKFKFSQGNIYAMVCFGSILILYINQQVSFLQLGLIDNLFRIIAIISFFLLIYKAIKSFNEIEQLNGKVNGTLELFTDKIVFNNQDILLNQIVKLEILVSDYNGKRNVLLLNTWYPSLSNGFGNTLLINLTTNEKIQIFFEQKFKAEFIRKNKTILIDYHKAGKISLISLLDILEIEDYEEIQRFKKSLIIN